MEVHQINFYNLWQTAPCANCTSYSLGGGACKVFKIGKLPININAKVYYNAVKLDGVGDWQSRIQV